MEIEQKILIVDDVKENLVAMESILDDCGAKLISVISGNEALKVLLNERISLILLDIQMPGIDGYETAKLIRGAQRTKDIPIIFVSAISKEERNIITIVPRINPGRKLNLFRIVCLHSSHKKTLSFPSIL